MDGLDAADQRLALPLDRNLHRLANLHERMISAYDTQMEQLRGPDVAAADAQPILDGYTLARQNHALSLGDARLQQAQRRLAATQALQNVLPLDLMQLVVMGSGFGANTVEESLSMY